MVSLVIATRNAHKVGEIRSILGAGFRCLDLNSFPGAPKVVEDAPTFAGNSAKKAEALAAWIAAGNGATLDPAESSFVLADDSGLEVDALQGAPGVHSARFAALDTGCQDNSTDHDNNAKLLRLLKDTPQERRTARFRCVAALTPIDWTRGKGSGGIANRTHLFDGACEGWIRFDPAGQGGFGYDPLFVPSGHEETFAQLGEDVKNRLSHRSMALAQLTAWFAKANSV